MTSAVGLQEQTKRAQCLLLRKPREIFHRITDFLRRTDLLVLHQVCKAFRDVEDLDWRFDINTQLRQFVTDPIAFRSQLGKHAALVSGGFALNYFDSGQSNIPILDLVVSAGEQSTSLTKYIEEAEGYKQDQVLVLAQGDAPITFSNGERPGRTIRVKSTEGPPLGDIFQNSFTTVNANFISWNKAYCLFPMETVIRHKFYTLKPMDENCGNFLRQSHDVGWTTRDMLMWKNVLTTFPQSLRGYRRVGDKASLIIPLITYKVQQPSIPTSTIEHAQFEICGPQVFAEETNLEIKARSLTSFVLRYEHIYASDEWYYLVDKNLRKWQRIELLKLEPNERPQEYRSFIPHESMINLPHDFRVPTTWH